jgi:formate-dependent nitrite reductase membrane component NrfD
MLWSTGAVGVILVSILGTTNYGGSAQELTFIIMTTSTMGMIFIGVGLLAGTAAPVALLLAAHVREQQTGLMLSAVLILVGSAALRYALLMGPQQLQTLY